MPSIGSIELLTLSGAVNPGTGEQVEEITRPGVDGVAFRRIGKRGIPFRMQSVTDVSSSYNAQNHINACKALQGTVIDIEDATGRTWSNYIVLRAQPTNTQKVTGASGGLTSSPAYLITIAWTLQATES